MLFVALLVIFSRAVAAASPEFVAARARATVRAAAPPPLAPRWRELLSSYWAVLDARPAGDPTTNCKLDLLAYEFSLATQPERAPLPSVFYALSLDSACALPPPPGPAQSPLLLLPWTDAQLAAGCAAPPFFVNASGGSDANDGTRDSPFATFARALAATRAGGARAPGAAACIVLREGTHGLGGATQVLTAGDSGLVVTGAAGEGEAWVSGGVQLPPLAWSAFNVQNGANVWVADVPPGVVESMPGLNTGSPLLRMRRAQFPNFDFEVDRKWINSGKDYINHYIKPPTYAIPTQFYIDLAAQGLKNDSTMEGYNRYGTGSGGPCAVWRGGIRAEVGWSYWCSNNSAGGGAGQDQAYMMNGYLGLPMGMVWNPAAPELPHFSAWKSIPPPEKWGPLWDNLPSFGAFQNPGWFTSHLAITGVDAAANSINMSADGVYPAGGWQGSRNWWGTKMGTPENEITSGPWFVENVFEELDAPAEFWFDAVSSKLYLFHNDTSGTPPPASLAFWVPTLEVLFNLSGTPSAPVRDVTFAGLAFRDQRKSLLADWMVPSGGDWSLRRAGGLHFEGTERITVSGCAFVRMDANAIFVGAYNRNTTIERNECVWHGMSCVVTFGYTEQNDCTAGEQPWGTQINFNLFHELGLQEMQSSAWFTGKTPLSHVEGNLWFNGPRAMANFNDGNCGGGSVFTRNLLFNTCRQSGDHGPANSWDRMPLLNTIATEGGAPSYGGLQTEVSHNYFTANYGGAQGFDNDDGSSFYTHTNNFVRGAGFKMDYGGHDSHFNQNAVIVMNGWNFLNVASFLTGHADTTFDNDFADTTQEKVEDLFDNCNAPRPGQQMISGRNNRFYTPFGNASANCDCCGKIPLGQLRKGLEDNFTASVLPPGDTYVAWGRAKLGL